jgi:hypothetical protein
MGKTLVKLSNRRQLLSTHLPRLAHVPELNVRFSCFAGISLFARLRGTHRGIDFLLV